MSIVRQLLAVSAVQAMRGVTLAGSNVFDSMITALDGLVKGRDKPVIIVSVEEVDQERKDDRGLFGRSSVAKLFIQTAVWTQADIEDPQNAGQVIQIGQTDAAREATLNILDRQWRAALSDPSNEWADLFRRLKVDIVSVRDQRMVDPENSARLAARFTEVTLSVVNEPEFGVGIPEDIDAGIAMLEAMSDYAHLGPIWRALLSTAADEWRVTQAKIMASDTVMGALGLSVSDSAGDVTKVTISIDGLPDITVE